VTTTAAFHPVRVPLALLALLAALVLGMLVAVWAFDAGPALLALDQRLFEALSGWEPPAGVESFREIVRDVTALGSLTVAGLIGLSLCVGLLAAGRRRDAMFVAVVLAIGVALPFLLKELVARPRPPAPPFAPAVASPSFPSAHASTALVVYATFATVLIDAARSRLAAAYTALLATVLVVATGASRVFLGVHYPADVASGWLLGGAWVLVAWLVYLRLVRRGARAQVAPAVRRRRSPRASSPSPDSQ
jgi:undecaprenyl-diphosphatase